MDYNIRQCPICNNEEKAHIVFVEKNEKVNRIKCELCGLIYFDSNTYPQPTYDLKYNRFFRRPGDIRKAGVLAALIGELLELHFIDPSFLEVGPGNGLTSFLIQQQGYRVEAIDMSWEACYNLGERLGVCAWPGRFENSELMNKYDFIYAGHVLEHSEDPKLFFSKAYEKLKPNGIFFFDTPDNHHAAKQGSKWKHFRTRNPYEHCSLMHRITIEKLAKLTSFKVENVMTLPTFESMQVLLRKKNNEPSII